MYKEFACCYVLLLTYWYQNCRNFFIQVSLEILI